MSCVPHNYNHYSSMARAARERGDREGWHEAGVQACTIALNQYRTARVESMPTRGVAAQVTRRCRFAVSPMQVEEAARRMGYQVEPGELCGIVNLTRTITAPLFSDC